MAGEDDPKPQKKRDMQLHIQLDDDLAQSVFSLTKKESVR